MPVQPIIPPEWGWAYDIAVGQDWPQADEDALRRLAQAWTDAMEALLTVADGGNAAAQNVNYSVQSVSSDEFNNYWSAYVDGDDSVVGQLARQSENLATQLLAFAEQTEFTKLSIDIQLILLFIQLLIDLVMAFVTFGASTAEGVVAAFITRLTVRGFLTELIKAVIMAVLPDVITQTIMLSEGHRSSFDVGETLQAAQMGVIGGLVGAGIGKGLGSLGEGLAKNPAERGATELLDSAAGKLASGLTNAAVHGALTNVTTNAVVGGVDSVENQIHAAVDPVYAKELRQQTQDQGYADQKSGENPLIAALNGAFTGVLFHGVHEASFDLAGKTFDATPLTLTDDAGNKQQFTALPIRDGSGSNYALFDESHQLVGKGTVGDSGAITITPNKGSPYDMQVVTLGDQKFAPVGPTVADGTPTVAGGTPTATPETSTQLASETPPEQQPSLPGSDHLASEQPVTSTGQPSADQTPSTTQAPPVQVPLVQVDQPAQAPPPAQSPDVPVTGTGVPVTGSDITVSPQPNAVTGSTELTSATLQDAYSPEEPAAAASSVTQPGAGDWFQLSAEHPESGEPLQPTELPLTDSTAQATGRAPGSSLTPQQAEDIERVPTVPLSWDRPLVFTDTGEAMAYAERVWDAAIRQLTPEQKAALMAYTGEAIVDSGDQPSYHSINRYLRGEIPPTPEILDSIARIDEALRLQPVPENLVVNRTTHGSVFVGADGRPVEHPADLLGLLGSVQEAPSYLSAHFGAYHPGGEEVALHLAVPEGTPALYLGTISVDPSQHELLLGRGLSLQIDRVWAEGEPGRETWHVQAHILPEHPAETAYTHLGAGESPVGDHAEIRSVTQQADHLLVTVGHGEHTAELRVDIDHAAGRVVLSTDSEAGDILREIAAKVRSAPGMFDVFGHADSNGLLIDGMHLPFRELDKLSLGIPEDAAIRLFGCQAGAGDAVAELAQVTQRDVIAANTDVWIDKNGYVIAASSAESSHSAQPNLGPSGIGDGTWQVIHPDGTRSTLTTDDPRHPPPPPAQSAGEAANRPGWSPDDSQRELASRQPRIPPDQFWEEHHGSDSYVVSNEASRALYKPETGVWRGPGDTRWASGRLFHEAWQDAHLWTEVPPDDFRYVRELAAYGTDRMLDFNLIPTTAEGVFDTTGARGPGSLQEWVPGSESQAVDRYPLLDQQRMAVLDYVTANSDRHPNNYLTGPDGRPVAIDHGETFPLNNENGITSQFVGSWLDRPLSPEVLAHVRAVDLSAFRDMLLARGITEQAADGAVARLREIQEEGMITGRAFGGEIHSPQSWFAQHEAAQPVTGQGAEVRHPVRESHAPTEQQPDYATGRQGSVSLAQLRGDAHPFDGGVRIAGTGDPILNDGMAPITVDNAFVVEVHGAVGRLFLDGTPVDLNASDLPEQLRALGWDGSKPIVLASCEAGLTRGAADQLAAALPGTDVIATDALVWRDRNGNVVASSEAIIGGRLQPTLVEENGHLTGDGVWHVHRAGAETRELPPEHPLNPTKPELISREAEFIDLAGRGIWREGDYPSAAALADEFGIPKKNQQLIQTLVNKHRIAIDLRPSNPDTARWLEQGGVPKPEAIKAKTINQYDVMLAPDQATRVALAANVGAVGFFKPAEPIETPVLDSSGQPTHPQLIRSTESDAVWAALQKRYASLMREYQANDESLSHLEEEGFFHVVDGVVYPYRAEIVNRLDIQLAPDDQARAVLEGSLRTPAYFRPAEPVDVPQLDSSGQPTHPQLVRSGESQGEWAALQKRYAQRLAEYLQITDSQTGLLATGKAAVVDGVVKPFALDPLPVPEGTPTVDPMLGPPVTGDHDMLNIRGLNDRQLPNLRTETTATGGTIQVFEFRDDRGHLLWHVKVPEGRAMKVTDFDGRTELMAEVVDSLGNRSVHAYQPNPDVWFEQLANEPGREKWDIPPMPTESGEAIAGGMGIMHGATAYWTPKSEQEIRIYGDIMREFGRDGDLLIRFQAGQPPTLVHSDTPVISGRIEAPENNISGLIEGPKISGLIEGPRSRNNPIIEALTGYTEQHPATGDVAAGYEGGSHHGTASHDAPAEHATADLPSGEHQSEGSSGAHEWPPGFRELPAPPEHPEWQGKLHYGNGCLIIGDEPGLAEGAGQAAPDGTLVIKAHGRGGDVFLGMDSQEQLNVTDPAFIRMLEDAGLKPGQPIVLASCEAGLDGGAADKLAAMLPGTTVVAADTAVWDDHQGGLFAASETVINGMPQPTLLAGENGAYHPDGAWRAHHVGTEPVPLAESDPHHPAVPVQLNPAVDYAPLAGSRGGGYQGDRFGPRSPYSPHAQVTDAFARRDPAPTIIVDPDHAGRALLGESDPSRIMPADVQTDPLNERLREYAPDLLDKASKKFQFEPFTSALDRQQAWVERRIKLEDAVTDAEQKVSDLQATFDRLKTPDRGLSEDQKRTAMRERNTVEQQLKKAKDFLGHRRQELTNYIRYPNQKIKLNLDVHSIPVDGNWDKAWVDFHDGAGDYPSVIDRLVALRGRTQNFDERYANALLDLATAPAGHPGISQSLRDLASALYDAETVTDFLNNPDRLKWLDRNNPVGTFLHDTAALMTLQLFVEGERNQTALVTNLANWHMVANGEMSIDEALGYFNVMGPRGSVQVAKASNSLGDPASQVPNDLNQSVAEMEMRQRQILALYAIATGKVPLTEDASGVTALNVYFAQDDAIQKMMADLAQRLRW